MQALLGIVAFSGLAGLAVGLVMLLFKRSYSDGKLISKVSAASLVGCLIFYMSYADQFAREDGYESPADRTAANKAGFMNNPAGWRAAKQQKEVERIAAEKLATETAELERIQARRAAEERGRIAAQKKADEEAKCLADLSCSAEKAQFSAGASCKPYVERLAKNDFQWIDGWLDTKFSRYRWSSDRRYITFIGDKIKYQNGFGAWTIYIYECDFDPKTERVIDVRATPGRLPP